MIAVCPKCDKSMFVLNFKDVESDFCPSCKGLWLDAGELELLLERTGASQDDAVMGLLQQKGVVGRGRKNLCPRCDHPLCEVVLGCHDSTQLTLDTCARGHGIWFDSDELCLLLSLFPQECGTSRTIEFLTDMLGCNRT